MPKSTRRPARNPQWASLIVKFTPPRGTPFGERWNDLLHAEATALTVLAEAGEPAARVRVITSERRSYLESLRFDRFGFAGRRHVVPLFAVHEAFVSGPLQHWGATCDALAAQSRLSADDARRVRRWRAFGQLIGNSDMHFGNLGLWADDIVRGRFSLAPCYDMLPMRYKPEPLREDFGMATLSLSSAPAEESGPLARGRRDGTHRLAASEHESRRQPPLPRIGGAQRRSGARRHRLGH